MMILSIYNELKNNFITKFEENVVYTSVYGENTTYCDIHLLIFYCVVFLYGYSLQCNF